MSRSREKKSYRCGECGASFQKWEGKCRQCGAWNSLEEVVEVPSSKRGWVASGSMDLMSLDQSIESQEAVRHHTGIGELDRVLGGGLVVGSMVLLGGAPGIGKSTLLLQLAGSLVRQIDARVLYVSSEESVGQIVLRSERLKVRDKRVLVFSESNVSAIVETAKRQEVSLIIVDSIQTVFLPDIPSTPGSLIQVRESAQALLSLAKNSQVSVWLSGHVTKDGNLAGPKVLEHMVDTVLSFDGDSTHQYRLLRSIKNRFGPTFELGVFQMEGRGLVEVAQPSELFLGQRNGRQRGSAVYAAIEGSRPLLCEVQALTIFTHMAMPKRTTVGFDANRLHLLGAVLDRHLGFELSRHDIFVNVVGGLRLEEPAADLAIVAALLSSHLQVDLPDETCFFGEIGLTGEVRGVSFVDSRVREALKMGFSQVVVPGTQRDKTEVFEGVLAIAVQNVAELARFINRAKDKAVKDREKKDRTRAHESPSRMDEPAP